MSNLPREDYAPIGAGLHYRLAGSAGDLPDIVLESGGLGAKRNWSVAGDLLAKRTRVLSYDRAGLGLSPADSQGCGAEAVAERLAKLVEYTGIRKPFLLAGYSLGGAYARWFAARYPESVAGLVLVDATPERLAMPEPVMRKAISRLKLLHRLARLPVARLVWVLGGRSMPLPEVRAVLDELGSADFMRNAIAELGAIRSVQDDVARDAPDLRHPTLAVIAGIKPTQMSQADWLSAQVQHRALSARAPAPLSRLEVNPAAHHGTVVNHPEHGRRLAEHIVEFAEALKR